MYLNSENASRFEKPVTVAYDLSCFSEGLVTSIFGASMVYFAGRAGCTAAEISSVLILYNLGFIFSSLFLVGQFDRLPGNRMLGGAVLTLVGVLGGLSFARVRWLLLVIAGGPIIANTLAVMKQRGLVSAVFGRFYGGSPSSYVPFVTFPLCAAIAQLIVMKVIERE